MNPSSSLPSSDRTPDINLPTSSVLRSHVTSSAGDTERRKRPSRARARGFVTQSSGVTAVTKRRAVTDRSLFGAVARVTPPENTGRAAS